MHALFAFVPIFMGFNFFIIIIIFWFRKVLQGLWVWIYYKVVSMNSKTHYLLEH